MSLPCDTEILNQAFINATQYMNPVIADRSKKYTSIFRSQIERGVFKYGEGYLKKAHTFFGGLAVQDNGASWSLEQPSRPPKTLGVDDPGYDSCRYESPVIGYGFEEKSYSLYRATRRSLDICLTDIMFKWQFEKQLAMIFNAFPNVTLGEWEQIERESYIDFCNKYVATTDSSAFGLQTFSYSRGDDHIDVPSGGFGSISILSQALLDKLYQFLFRQCPEAAIGNADGMPTFGLVTSMESSRDVIDRDPNREDYRYANPQILVKGYGQVKTVKGYNHIICPDVPRFVVNATGTELTRVHPYTTTPTTIGDAVNVNNEYLNAPFEMSIILIKDVYKALVPPANPAKIARGYEFDPVDNLGEFFWINGWDRCNNILREKGFFFMRMRMAAEPGAHSDDAIAILHRRCTTLEPVLCNTDGVCTEVNVLSAAQHDTEEAAADCTVYDITLDDEVECGPGEMLKITFTTLKQDVVIVSANGDNQYTVAFSAARSGGWLVYDTGMTKAQCVTCGGLSLEA